ncbi:MAG TPA: hypothetical protein PLP05_08070 [Sedimentisphaerales bacterium]|nr:hypothetical protein [Sedimentisphaerales bacterium]
MRNSGQLFLFTLTIFVLPLFTGCGVGGKSSDSMGRFLFETDRVGTAVNAIGGNICVKTFEIASPFDSDCFVYKRANNDYETDYYNRFVTCPDLLITQQCQKWLEKSGIFSNVLSCSSAVTADYILEGNVISLYGDFSEEKPTFAVMQIRFFLIKETGDKALVVFNKEYNEKIEVAAASPADIVSGYDKCLANILNSFEKDLGSLSF